MLDSTALSPPNGPVPVAAYMRMSTEMQQYSILNQTRAITGYANAHGMVVTRTYRDDGRSGLTIEHRPGLLALLRDIANGPPGYTAVLVLDVSRWGRFQNVDESAYYEFLCWKAGVRICYVAELFENDGTPFAMVVKGIKRAMAAEYSRELSAKVSAGQRTVAKLGYHLGAPSGYGFRRLLVSAGGMRKGLLAVGERKSIATDRVLLVPGPMEELRTVRWMFDQCLNGATCLQIARVLNQKGIPNSVGKAWTYQTVKKVLGNEKLAGVAVFGKQSKKLAGGTVHNPPSTWVRADTPFAPIVLPDTFARVQKIRLAQGQHMSNAEIVERVRRLYEREGRITGPLLDAEPGLLSSHVCARRFGTLPALYAKVGYVPRRNPRYGQVRAWITAWRESLTAFTAEFLAEAGSTVGRDGWKLTVDDAWTVSFTVINGHGRNPVRGWFNHRRSEDTDIVVFAKGMYDEEGLRDYLVLPRSLFPIWPSGFYGRNGPKVDSCTYPSLAILGDLARLSRMDSQLCG